MPAPTAEALMRSRYTAYVQKNADYLRRTWHPDTRPPQILDDTPTQWIGLKIIRAENGGPGDETGLVEFIARYKINGRAFRLQEASRFTRLDGQWVYRDGEIQSP